MKKYFYSLAITICALATSMSVNASLLTYEISQTGWKGGGDIYGIFSGMDLNHDGHINISNGELSLYEVSFTGNSVIGSFSHTLADLMFFDYTIGSEGFLPSYPLYSYDGNYFYDADDRVIASLDHSVVISSSEYATVSAVPLPSTSALMMVVILLPFMNRILKSKSTI